MYLAVLRKTNTEKTTRMSSSLAGLLQELDGATVSNVMVIAGPLGGDVIEILRRAFPPENDTYIITTKPVASTDSKCISIAGAPLATQKEYKQPVAVSIAGSKGGVGKSTLCLLLALYLYKTSAADKRNIVVIDADVQAGLSCWFSGKAEKGQRIIPITPDGKVQLFSSAYGEYNPAVPEIVGWYLGANWVIVDNGNNPDRIITAPCMVMVTSASEMTHAIYEEALRKTPVSVDVTVVSQDLRILASDRRKYIRQLQQIAQDTSGRSVHPGQVLVLPEMELPGSLDNLIQNLIIYLEGDKKLHAVLEQLVQMMVRRYEETMSGNL